MSKILKRRYMQTRKEFRQDLYVVAKQNKALAMLVIVTFNAWHHRDHIGKIWYMFRKPEYAAFHAEYSEKLFGQHLAGRDDIWKSLFFGCHELYNKYHGRIPEMYAMGDALSVAYKALKE